MNFKNFALKAIAFLPVFSTIALNTNIANASTRITFAKGSYCGSYTGDFSGGREFILNLGRGQTFTTRNTGNGVQYDMYVYGQIGSIYGERVSYSQINYQIPIQGDYHVYIESNNTYNSVEFCAY